MPAVSANAAIDEMAAELSRESMADAAMDLPLSLQHLLNNEWLHQNMSQMLNISMGNLTSLLISAQNTIAQKSQPLPRVPMPLLITLTTFYALIFVAGILGNLITCFVISKCKFMHTATNFYLFNLAVSDLILLLSGMPQDLYNLWYPDSYPSIDALCVMESVLSETAANATVLTITAFTVERYIAICHPFRQHTMSKLSRAIKFIFAIWVCALLLALPQAMQFSVVTLDSGGTSCTMQNDFFAHVFAVSGFIFFGGPMTAICVLYVLIGVKLKRSRLLQAVPRRAYEMQRGISAQGRVIRMLVAVAVAFFLCWAPFHAQRLMAVYGSTAGISSQIFNDIFKILDYTAGVLYFLSTCINPLLYNIMSHKFREAFKVTLARHFGIAGYQVQNRNYSALLRQNGSVRLHTFHTTVNNNALEHLSSYRIVQLQCRDPSHHLSLQDSIRTTITTTASVGGGGGGSNSCRSSTHRNRCNSKASLPMIPHRSEIFTSSMSTKNGVERPPRILHKQISQLSSVGDANSLLEAEGCGSYRLKELDGQAPGKVECASLNSSQEWDESIMPQLPAASEIETPAAVEQSTTFTTVNSVAELNPATRSRLKLSRIITRRERSPFPVQTNASQRVSVQDSPKNAPSTSQPRARRPFDIRYYWCTKRAEPKQAPLSSEISKSMALNGGSMEDLAL